MLALTRIRHVWLTCAIGSWVPLLLWLLHAGRRAIVSRIHAATLPLLSLLRRHQRLVKHAAQAVSNVVAVEAVESGRATEVDRACHAHAAHAAPRRHCRLLSCRDCIPALTSLPRIRRRRHCHARRALLLCDHARIHNDGEWLLHRWRGRVIVPGRLTLRIVFEVLQVWVGLLKRAPPVKARIARVPALPRCTLVIATKLRCPNRLERSEIQTKLLQSRRDVQLRERARPPTCRLIIVRGRRVCRDIG